MVYTGVVYTSYRGRRCAIAESYLKWPEASDASLSARHYPWHGLGCVAIYSLVTATSGQFIIVSRVLANGFRFVTSTRRSDRTLRHSRLCGGPRRSTSRVDESTERHSRSNENQRRLNRGWWFTFSTQIRSIESLPEPLTTDSCSARMHESVESVPNSARVRSGIAAVLMRLIARRHRGRKMCP